MRPFLGKSKWWVMAAALVALAAGAAAAKATARYRGLDEDGLPADVLYEDWGEDLGDGDGDDDDDDVGGARFLPAMAVVVGFSHVFLGLAVALPVGLMSVMLGSLTLVVDGVMVMWGKIWDVRCAGENAGTVEETKKEQ